MATGRALATAALVCAAALAAAGARAQPSPEQSAQVYFDRGLALADRGEWAAAIEAFERAREIAPLPAVLFNLAEARRRAGRAREALDAYIEYLDRASAASQYRALAQEHVAELERRLARVRFEVTPEGAEVRVDDGEVAGARREVVLDPGHHAVVVRARGYEPDARGVSLAEGERVTLSIHLARAPEPAQVVVAPPPPPPPPPAPESTYRNAFQLAAVTHSILDDSGIGFGIGLRAGLRLARSWELVLGLSHETTNGVGYVVGGLGFYYVSHAASPIAIYMGALLGVLVPQCTTSCTYETSGNAAETDMAALVTVGARFEITRWFGPFLELNGGVARFSDLAPLIFFGTGLQFSLPM